MLPCSAGIPTVKLYSFKLSSEFQAPPIILSLSLPLDDDEDINTVVEELTKLLCRWTHSQEIQIYHQRSERNRQRRWRRRRRRRWLWARVVPVGVPQIIRHCHTQHSTLHTPHPQSCSTHSKFFVHTHIFVHTPIFHPLSASLSASDGLTKGTNWFFPNMVILMNVDGF